MLVKFNLAKNFAKVSRGKFIISICFWLNVIFSLMILSQNYHTGKVAIENALNNQ